MSLLQRIQDVVNATTQLMLDSNTRFTNALQQINQVAPNYTADNLVRDVTQTGLQTLNVWLTFLRPLGDPMLPTVTIAAPAGTIRGNPLQGTVSVVAPVPLNIAPTVTPLVFTGWSVVPAATDASQIAPLVAVSPIPAANMDALRQQLTVILNVPVAAPVPQQGTYEGFVLNGPLPASAPIARVVVRSL